MPLTISDTGQDNTFTIDPDMLAESMGSIVVAGNRNEIIIGAGSTLAQGTIRLGGNCRVLIGENCRLAQAEIWAADDCEIVVGAGTAFTWHTRILMHEPSSVSIGQRCLIASETLLMTSDMHSILDRDTGKRVNPAKNIAVGDDVWLAGEVALMKGAIIGAGSAIGFRSVVTGTIPPNCLAAGSPAQVLRKKVAWRHELL